MARLVAHPGRTLTFEEFCALPGPAVALDGYVAGPAAFAEATHASFDHHAGCDRLATRSTCEQVAFALRARCPVIVDESGRVRDDLTVYVNDADPDVAFSWWLLTRPQLANMPAVEHLVAVEGAIDCAGGCDVGIAADDLATLAWVVDPWAQARGRLASSTAAELVAVVEAVAARLDDVAAGHAGRVEVAATVDVLATVGRTVVVVEHHPLARAGLHAVADAGFVSVRPGPTSGTCAFTVGVVSPWTPVDLAAVYADLNAVEGTSGPGGWGGSDRVGGSPRAAGSRLSFQVVAEVLDRHLR